MAILKHGALQPDDWRGLADDETLPDTGKVVVSLERWKAEHEKLAGRNAPVAVRLKNDQPAAEIGDDLARLAMVQLEFPKFTDGRGFSQARILRQHLGFKGEIRATGNVLRDQYLFMTRCGIDAIELPDDANIAGYLDALDEFSVWYQPAADDRVPAIERRRARRSGRAADATAAWAY